MREQPTGDKLLESARTLLRDELIPALPAEKRHAALMIANALGIAARQLKNGDTPDHEEIASLARLLAVDLATEGNLAIDRARLQERQIELNRQLCLAIRQGRADNGDLRDAIQAHLLHFARHRVAESNPKFLGQSA